MTLKIGRNRPPIHVATLHEASARYLEEQRAYALSTLYAKPLLPDGWIYDGTKRVARISANGNVWPPKSWQPGDAPILKAQGV